LEPEILVVDEVLAVGDMEFQKKCLGKMDEVSRTEGRTILFVSHDLQAVTQLTQRTLVMAGGRVAFDGPTSEAVGRYKAMGRTGGGTGAEWTEEAGARGSRVSAVRVVTAQVPGVHISGEDLVVEYEVAVDEPVEDLAFSFQVRDEQGVPVTLVWYQDPGRTRPDHMLGALQPGRHVARCRLPRWWLFMGRYTVTAMLFSMKSGRFAHVLNDVVEFEVMMPSGMLHAFQWQAGSAKVLADASWSEVEAT
jgi:lipopolysaccharide transport system ATP-binding protein